MSASPKRLPAIVLVEDEPEVLILLHRLLQDLNATYDIVTVTSSAEALVQIALRPVPLLIVDDNTQGINAIVLMRTVKVAYPTTRVALITATATPALKRKAHAAGVDSYLAKPFPLARLETIVREACSAARGPKARKTLAA